MKEIDCRGLACPQPVLNVKDALEQMDKGRIRVTVDNQPARDNVTRFAQSRGCGVESSEKDGLFTLTITKGDAGPLPEESPSAGKQTAEPALVIKISSRLMGAGDDELGRVLMTAFIKTLAEASVKPKALVFYNSGVYLTCEGSSHLEAVKALEEAGVNILSCGTCLDFYGLKEKIAVGRISNMFEIVETLSGADRIVSP